MTINDLYIFITTISVVLIFIHLFKAISKWPEPNDIPPGFGNQTCHHLRNLKENKYDYK